MGVPQPDYGARHVAALVLIVEPGRQRRIDPAVVATTLGLTPPESQVAGWLAEGKSVGDIAQTTGLSKHTLYWHLRQIYQKKSISRQVDLVRLVLSVAEFGQRVHNAPTLIFCVMTRVLVAGRRKAALLKSRSREPLDDQAQLVVCRSVVVKREDARPVSAGPMQTCPIDSVRLSTLACLNAVLRQAAGRPNRLAALPGEA